MNERQRRGFRGPVQACRVQRTWYLRQCGGDSCETEERGDITTVDFRTDGSLARQWHQNPDGSDLTVTYEYNAAGLLTTMLFQNGAQRNLQCYEYDAEGRLARIITRPQGGSDRTTETYEYDANGQKRKTRYVDVAAQRPNTHYSWGVEGTDSGYSAPGVVVTITTLYNDREQPTDLLFYDRTAGLLSRVEFTYNGDGKMVEEAQTNVADTLPAEMLMSLSPAKADALRALLGGAGRPIRRMHSYNDQGRRSATRLQMSPFGEDRRMFSYNHHGDQVEELSDHESREYEMDDKGQLSDVPSKERLSHSEARSDYDYDAYGNWLKKTIECRNGADQPFTLSSVEQRTISYFN